MATTTTFTTSTTINASAQRVWEVLADIGSIYTWNPGVKHSYTTSDHADGENAARHCDLQSASGKKIGYLKERAINWREGKGYTIEITDTNLPFKTATVTFQLIANGDETTVTVTPEYRLKYGPLGRLVDALAGRRAYRQGMQQLLAGLKYRVETGKKPWRKTTGCPWPTSL